MLTVGSLFSGIGGLDLGLERAGMQVRWQVEIDPYCNKVLEKHWPKVTRYGNIKSIDWSGVEPVDLICGGFPCQPVSVAGEQKGDADDRWLWPEFLRAIREVRPHYALVENVPGLLSTDDGRLARGVFGDLAEVGYDAEWGIVSAADVGAPHLRRRVFIVAFSNGSRLEEHGMFEPTVSQRPSASEPDTESEQTAMAYPGCKHGKAGLEVEGIVPGMSEDGRTRNFIERSSEAWAVPDPNEGGLQAEGAELEAAGVAGVRPSVPNPKSLRECRQRNAEGIWAVEPIVGGVADGLSAWMDGVAEDGNGFYAPRATAEKVRNRSERLECLGNAVVPQVAEYIGRMIVEAENR